MSYLKKSISTFIIGVLLGISTVAVFAYSFAASDWGYYGPVHGYDYRNQSTLSDWDDNGIYAAAWAETTDSDIVPVGYIGVNARLYRNGSLYIYSDWDYNEEETSEYFTYTNDVYGTGDYYSKGQSKAYNGDGYYIYEAFKSPIIQRE